jgi:hypothetical protein
MPYTPYNTDEKNALQTMEGMRPPNAHKAAEIHHMQKRGAVATETRAFPRFLPFDGRLPVFKSQNSLRFEKLS